MRVSAPGHPESRTPPFIERIWMPAYAIRLHATSRQGEQHVWTSVDAWTGQFSILECMDQLGEHITGGDLFSAGIDKAQAVALARHGLLQFVMRVRGERGKPVVDAVEEVRLYYFPVWVLYFRRGRRGLDVRTLNAFTGKDGGAKLRVAVLNAMVAAHKQ